MTKNNLAGTDKPSADRPPAPSRSLYNRDGIRIETDEGGLTAFLSYTPNPRLPALEEAKLKSALEKSGVSFGVDEEALQRISGAGDALRAVVVARGRPAVPGKPPEIDYKFATDPYALRGAKSEKDRIDYRDRGPLPFVSAGDEVAMLIPGTDPIHGRSVTGKEIRADIELAEGLKPGRNVEVQDGRYVAKIEGGPRLDDKGRIEVDENWIVDGNIDIHTGNLIYPGGVDVRGVVHAGFEVNAKSVRIRGVEKNAVVKAGEDVVIGGGILGGKVSAGGSVIARFIDNAAVTSVGDVNVKLSVINSDIRSSGVTKAQTIIGGTVMSLKGVQCVNLSSEASRATLIFGIDPITQEKIGELVHKKVDIEGQIHQKNEEMAPLLDGIDELNKKKKELSQLELEFESLGARIEQGGGDAEQQEMLKSRSDEIEEQIESLKERIGELEGEIASIRPEYHSQEREVAKLRKTLEELERQHEKITSQEVELKEPPKIRITGKVLAGTKLSSAHARLVVKEDMSRITFQERKRSSKELAEAQEKGPLPRYWIHMQHM